MDNKKWGILVIILAVVLSLLVILLIVIPKNFGPTPGFPSCESKGGLCIPTNEGCAESFQEAPEDMNFHCEKKDTVCCIKTNSS